MQDATSDVPEGGLEAGIRALAEPLAEPLGAEVLVVDVRGQKGRRLVRITADARELGSAGLDIDTIATLSRRLGKALDEHDPIAGGYTLEVTSPGADRPLHSPRDFARNIGREVRVVLTPNDREDADAEPSGATAETGTTGTVTAVSETELRLDVEGAVRVVPLDEIDHGVVVLPW